MHFDFSAFLVLATFITGLIWLVDVLVFKKSRLAENKITNAATEESDHEPVVVEYARSFFPVLLLVLVLRSFMFEPFKIPSGSMMPTLLVGDFILVNKYAYGVRIPVWEKEVWDTGKPERGDVAVFRYPKDLSLDYIKRIIGLPGDEVSYYNKTLSVNGEAVTKLAKGEYPDKSASLMQVPMLNFEQVLGEHTFDILEQPSSFSPEGTIMVPDGHYFVMGDNRDNSNDSRVWGFVPAENLVGRAGRIWMSWDSDNTRVRFSRVGQSID